MIVVIGGQAKSPVASLAQGCLPPLTWRTSPAAKVEGPPSLFKPERWNTLVGSVCMPAGSDYFLFQLHKKLDLTLSPTLVLGVILNCSNK